LLTTLKFLSKHGIDLLLAGANVSEYHSLITQKIKAVVETMVNGICDRATVMARNAGSVRTAIDIGRVPAQSNIDLLMVIPSDNPLIHEQRPI
jgi:dihydrodipicolinate synthase/N-acetylneuraminate lyase